MKVGLLGGGQLGRMLALAGHPLGLSFRVFHPEEAAPADAVAEPVVGAYADTAQLERFAAGLDVVTYEFENVPVAAARHLATCVPAFYPLPDGLQVAQDRLTQKTFLSEIGVRVPAFCAANSAADLEAARTRLGAPCLAKTRTLGYDGKGQRRLEARTDLAETWRDLGERPLIVEQWVNFDREVSLIAVRSSTGETAFYPLVQNDHRAGILRLTQAPAPGLAEALQAQAEGLAVKILESMKYVGVLAIEMFQCGAELLVNEMATRVHNSGHWTIEGAPTSQFENHLRAILGWPLGGTRPGGATAMINLIGSVPEPPIVLAVKGAHLHLYGKSAAPGRKLGHITLTGADHAALRPGLESLSVWMQE